MTHKNTYTVEVSIENKTVDGYLIPDEFFDYLKEFVSKNNCMLYISESDKIDSIFDSWILKEKKNDSYIFKSDNKNKEIILPSIIFGNATISSTTWLRWR